MNRTHNTFQSAYDRKDFPAFERLVNAYCKVAKNLQTNKERDSKEEYWRLVKELEYGAEAKRNKEFAEILESNKTKGPS